MNMVSHVITKISHKGCFCCHLVVSNCTELHTNLQCHLGCEAITNSVFYVLKQKTFLDFNIYIIRYCCYKLLKNQLTDQKLPIPLHMRFLEEPKVTHVGSRRLAYSQELMKTDRWRRSLNITFLSNKEPKS